MSSSETDGKVVKVVLEKNQPVDPLPESTVADEKKIENDEIVKTAANELYLYGSLATGNRFTVLCVNIIDLMELLFIYLYYRAPQT